MLFIFDISIVSDTGGYLLGNTTGTYAIDCFEACRRGQCLASFANCPLNCYNVVQIEAGTCSQCPISSTCYDKR